jgi:hypothetical protein
VDYCLSFVLFLKTISLSVLVNIFGIFKLFLHTMHLTMNEKKRWEYCSIPDCGRKNAISYFFVFLSICQ